MFPPDVAPLIWFTLGALTVLALYVAVMGDPSTWPWSPPPMAATIPIPQDHADSLQGLLQLQQDAQAAAATKAKTAAALAAALAADQHAGAELTMRNKALLDGLQAHQDRETRWFAPAVPPIAPEAKAMPG